MELSVLTCEGKETGRKVDLNTNVFGVEPNDNVIYLEVKGFLANQRQGTSATKERAYIKGSTRKLRKQKGTGGARVGSIKNPLFRGGGRVFGPRPRDYGIKINKKIKALARKSALSYKAKEEDVVIVEAPDFQKPQTKRYIDFLRVLSLHDSKTLFVLPETNQNVVLSARNFSKTKVVTASQLTTYDVLHADKLIFVESSLEKINQMFN